MPAGMGNVLSYVTDFLEKSAPLQPPQLDEYKDEFFSTLKISLITQDFSWTREK